MRAVHRRIVNVLAIAYVGLSSPLYGAETALLLPNSFRAYLLDAAGSPELVPEWTKQARAHLHTAMVEEIERSSLYDIAPMPALCDAQLSAIEEHVALFEANANAAMEMRTLGDAGQERRDRPYTLGAGLEFLASAGIDTLVLISGRQTWSTRGRLVSKMLTGGASGRIAPGGPAGLLVGYVDTASGNILWMNVAQPARDSDVRELNGARSAVAMLVAQYPDGLLYALQE